MKRFTGHTEPWGDFVDVKINAPDLIPEKTLKYRDKFIFISSVTDSYLPLERKYQLTRKILEKLLPLKINLGIQTKSDLILQDIDLLKQFEKCEVGFTITTLDENLQKEIEPFTSSPKNRIEAIKKLKKCGLKTYIFIGPIMPFLTDWEKIIEETKEFTDFYMFENLNVKGITWVFVKKWLELKHPELLKDYENIYFSKNSYWQKMEEEIKSFCDEKNINYKIYFNH